VTEKNNDKLWIYGILKWEGSDYTGSVESDSDRYLLGTAVWILWTHTPVCITCKHF